MTQRRFIEATHEDGTKAFINLNMVGWIKIENNRYLLNILGNKYFVSIDCNQVKELIKQS